MKIVISQTSKNRFKRNEKGMTLIDVAIAMIIIGLLITPSLYALREYKKEKLSPNALSNR